MSPSTMIQVDIPYPASPKTQHGSAPIIAIVIVTNPHPYQSNNLTQYFLKYSWFSSGLYFQKLVFI